MTTEETRGDERIELVTFDLFTGGEWRDSFEGGQYVMLIAPESPDYRHNCHVDVNIQLSMPDVCQSENDLWVNRDHGETWRHSGDLYHYLRNRAEETTGVITDKPAPEWYKRFRGGRPDYREWARWALRAISPEDLSRSVLFAAHLGSSPHSMYNETGGFYWTATLENLTDTGRALYDVVKATYGVEPLLLTFLDT